MNMKISTGCSSIVKAGFPRTFLSISMLTFLIVISGCSGKSEVRPFNVESDTFSELRGAVHNAIDDPEREAKALAIVDNFGEEMLSLLRLKADRQTQFKKLNANYDSTRAEFDALLRDSDESIRLIQQRVVEQRKAFIAVTTPEEWALIYKARQKVLDSALKSIKST